ncbi:50S ribosomal protein L15 [Mesohalobacter halotolerans]|uniref:Large ribosomal subunit protein uL15 n=1 Tax=Mesohalobacter halotolerans TaxID=1883405 RepID=A0A4U5TNQ4_9FLAO|nr:50S ribosomal protein L15 [Mesohalobacter halotolerans]MBS3738134.1 50S ribosomal protein L15 [Psychroflexus sp.]TKS55647.1 50S ribosomal protein L15 [Mesohalobacter halotolerans]
MKLHELKPAKGSVKGKTKRLGRGEGSGTGDTAGRGHKGAKSRSGYSKKIGFEGGQMPLQRRIPKFGFTNRNRVQYKPVNLSDLQALADNKKIKDSVDKETLVSLGLVKKKDLVKILGNGEIETKLKVKAHQFSKTAKEAIEKAGGEAITL